MGGGAQVTVGDQLTRRIGVEARAGVSPGSPRPDRTPVRCLAIIGQLPHQQFVLSSLPARPGTRYGGGAA